jgi:phosphopantetheinyl transferase (holo-ACP synthase)
MSVPTNHILGVGTDILQLSRIRKVITRTPWALNSFARRILSQEEITDWQRQQHKTQSITTNLEFNLRYLATR